MKVWQHEHRDLLARAKEMTRSPIEYLFVEALIEGYACGSPELIKPGHDGTLCYLRGWAVNPQRKVGRYSLDVAIECGGGAVAVECDGHQFHERTPEQAEHDRKRDRALTAQGWTVIRFTGREIVRDPFACACEAIRHVRRVEEDALAFVQAQEEE